MKSDFKKLANKRRNRKARQRYASKPKAFKKAVTTIVKAVEKRRAETKFNVSYPISIGGNALNTFQGFSSAITSSNEVYSLIPAVLQGSQSHQREGDYITPLSLTIKGRVSIQDRVSSSTDINVFMFFLTAKACKSLYTAGLTSQAIPTSRLLDTGQDTKVPFDGSFYTSMLPINKEEFNVIKVLKFRLSKSTGTHNQVALGAIGVFPDIATSAPPSTFARDFSVKIPVPAKYSYTNASGGVSPQNAPSNHYPFMVCGWTYADGSGDTIPNSTIVQIEAQSHLYFQDPQ